MGCTRSYNID
jgi:hypothetical protein